jgi:hypothetical protein
MHAASTHSTYSVCVYNTETLQYIVYDNLSTHFTLLSVLSLDIIVPLRTRGISVASASQLSLCMHAHSVHSVPRGK